MAVYDEPVFEEPELKPRKGKYEAVLEPLKKKPGKWGRIGEYKSPASAYQAALNLRGGDYIILGEPDEWEFVAEENAVFARYKKDQKEKSKK